MPLRLFDEGPRTDRSPGSRAEGGFALLNRVDRPHLTRVRDLLEEWFAEVPTEVQVGLRSRFRKDNAAQHVAAFWELYLHQTHRRLGFTLEYEPGLPGTSRTPDFLVHRGDERFYLEATLVRYSDAETARRRRQDLLLDLVDRAFDADFYVHVRVAAAGPTTPARKALVDPIETWLAGLQWASARQAAEAGAWDAPERTFEASGSVVTLEAHPKPPHLRYDREIRTICAGPAGGGTVDERAHILKDLQDKARAYGRPDAPYVVAALCMRDLASYRDIESALYGREVVQIPVGPDGPSGESYITRDFKGLWQYGQAPRYTRVSGVIGAVGLAPWSIAGTPLSLWKNPWAARPLAVDFPCRTVEGDLAANHLVVRDATRAPHELFGLPRDWPGPGGPFDD